jgi:hypothetical protein
VRKRSDRVVSLGVFVDEQFLDRVDREILRWGLDRQGVVRDAITACVLGPSSLGSLYPRGRQFSSPESRKNVRKPGVG